MDMGVQGCVRLKANGVGLYGGRWRVSEGIEMSIHSAIPLLPPAIRLAIKLTPSFPDQEPTTPDWMCHLKS